MKKLLIAIIIILLGVFICKSIQTKPDANVPEAIVSDSTSIAKPANEIENPSSNNAAIIGKQTDNSKVAVAFTGFGPGKKHVGSFSDVRSNLSLDTSGKLSGNITVGMASLTTDNEAVTKHLKTADFFDVTKYPTAIFTVKEDLTSLNCGPAEICQPSYLYGTFTIHGVTKEVSFPVIKTSTELKANFVINMKEFGIDQKFANETIELNVVVPLK